MVRGDGRARGVDREVDRVTDAMRQMAEHTDDVLRRVRDAASDAAYLARALSCLRELRRKSVEHDEPSAFNGLLRRLKARHCGSGGDGVGGDGGGGETAFVWERLVGDASLKGGLISTSETEESDVSPDAAARFWSAMRDGDGDGAGGAAVDPMDLPTQDDGTGEAEHDDPLDELD